MNNDTPLVDVTTYPCIIGMDEQLHVNFWMDYLSLANWGWMNGYISLFYLSVFTCACHNPDAGLANLDISKRGPWGLRVVCMSLLNWERHWLLVDLFFRKIVSIMRRNWGFVGFISMFCMDQNPGHWHPMYTQVILFWSIWESQTILNLLDDGLYSFLFVNSSD